MASRDPSKRIYNKDGTFDKRKFGKIPEAMKKYQFKKGVVTNPKGRPKGPKLLTAINEVLDRPDKKTGKPRVYRVARAFVNQAEKGSFVHAKEILDRQEGKTVTRIGDPDGQPMKMYVGMPIDGDESP